MQFDLSRSQAYLIYVANTEARQTEVGELIELALRSRKPKKAIVLRGKLGLVDSFLDAWGHILQQLAEHAYGRTAVIDDDLIAALQAMLLRFG